MSLGEYLWAGTSISKWIYHLNWNSNDSSGNGYNWTDTNITYANGINGTQLATFNGTTSKIAVWNDRWGFTGDFTVAFKFIPNNLTTYQTLLSNFNINPSVTYWYWWIARLSNTWKIELVIANDSSVLLSDTTTLSTWVKYNVVIKRVNWAWSYIYINWVLTASNTSTFNQWYSGVAHSTIWWLEYLWWSYITEQFFNWSIDEVICENVAWTDTQIQRYNTFSKWLY